LFLWYHCEGAPVSAQPLRDSLDASALFERLPLPGLLLTPAGEILAANPAWGEVLGKQAAPGLLDWVHPEQRHAVETALVAARTGRERVRFALNAGDPPREIDAVIEAVGPHRPADRLLFLGLDVSREMLLQRKLLQADRLSQLGALVSGVAHELNNPLAAIAAFAEVMKLDARGGDTVESASVIHAEAMRAGRVVQTLLDFARQRPRVSQAVDVKDVAERVVALHRSALRKARIQVTTAIGDDVPTVLGDPQELQQVLLNTVVNAEQAIAATGQPGRIRIAARVAKSRVILAVEDSGPGIPPAILDRVFEPFFTTKGEAGTGLGLAISQSLVQANGGRMAIENIAGGGARVAIELVAESTRPAAVPAPQFRRAERPLSVFVVDDDESVRRGLIRMAERLGHRASGARSFAGALRRLRHPDTPFDAVLLDVHLDDANSGFELFDALRVEGRGRDRQVIFTTGDSVSLKTRDRLQRSERPVLKKPFNLDELRAVLDRVGAA
jgi:signal transduction histidine kinase/ActR/RegA family two-component response regulator